MRPITRPALFLTQVPTHPAPGSGYTNDIRIRVALGSPPGSSGYTNPGVVARNSRQSLRIRITNRVSTVVRPTQPKGNNTPLCPYLRRQTPIEQQTMDSTTRLPMIDDRLRGRNLHGDANPITARRMRFASSLSRGIQVRPVSARVLNRDGTVSRLSGGRVTDEYLRQ